MTPRRLQLRALPVRELALAAALCGALAVLVVLASRRLGDVPALLLPLGIALGVVLLMRPVALMSLTIGLAIVAQGQSFGLLTFQAHLYDLIYKRLTPLDVLIILSLLAVALDVLRTGRPLRFPRGLALFDVILVLAMLSGVIVGKGNGAHVKYLFLAENVFLYLLLLPLAVFNLELGREQLRTVLGVLFALSLFLATIGTLEALSGSGLQVEAGGAKLSFYEPTPNWVVMSALLGVAAAAVARLRPPLWMLLGIPLLLVETVLSYRRSFWIATALGLALVVLLGLSPVGRRLLVPSALVIALAIWLLGSINFQSQSPVLKRFTSLSPTSLSNNVQDRYRLDERANIRAELERHPVSGLGLLVPWEATARPLSVEHEGGREYVHFAALYWWLKLGILGLFAYLLLLLSTALLAWKVWRRGRGAAVRAFGLASLCGTAGLLAAETTATFTGSDLRFSVVLAAGLGLLARMAEDARSADAEAGTGTAERPRELVGV